MQYALSESGNVAGYTNGATWNCTGDGNFVSPDKISVPAGKTATCTIINTRDTGSLKLSKALTGGPAGFTGPFTIHYVCDAAHTGDVQVNAGSFQTISGIPTGTQCTVTEPTLPTVSGYSFGTPTFTDSWGTANDGIVTIAVKDATVEVTTNNTLTRDTGSLKLSKALTGGPAGFTGPFTIHYVCDAAHTGDVQVNAGSFQTISGIPTGTQCTVTEPTLPTVSGYSFGTPTFTDRVRAP